MTKDNIFLWILSVKLCIKLQYQTRKSIQSCYNISTGFNLI